MKKRMKYVNRQIDQKKFGITTVDLLL